MSDEVNSKDISAYDESILTTIKRMLSIVKENKDFDTEIIVNINSVFTILNQLGVGPGDGFRIKDDTAKWSDYISEKDDLDAVKSYIYLKVKTIFDPPLNGTVMDAHKQLIAELEWRLNVKAEGGN